MVIQNGLSGPASVLYRLVSHVSRTIDIGSYRGSDASVT